MMPITSSGRFAVIALIALLVGASASSCTATAPAGGSKPTESAPTEPRATQSEPTERIATQSEPTEPEPTEPRATQSDPTPEPTEPEPTEPTPGAVERPGAHNTGPVDVAALEPIDDGVTIETPGTVLENVDIQGHIDIRASDVTVRNFRVDAGTAYYGIQVRPDLSNVVIEDGEITNSDSAGVYCQSACTLRRLHIHDHDSDGMKLSGTNGSSLVEFNFVTKLGTGEGSHADGNQSVIGTDLTFRYNNFYMPVPGTEAHDAMPLPDGVTAFRSNAAFIIHDETDNILIENNWLNGGNYTVYGNPGTTVRNNIFGPDFRYGICNGPFDDWSGNVMEDGAPAGDNNSCN